MLRVGEERGEYRLPAEMLCCRGVSISERFCCGQALGVMAVQFLQA